MVKKATLFQSDIFPDCGDLKRKREKKKTTHITLNRFGYATSQCSAIAMSWPTNWPKVPVRNSFFFTNKHKESHTYSGFPITVGTWVVINTFVLPERFIGFLNANQTLNLTEILKCCCNKHGLLIKIRKVTLFHVSLPWWGANITYLRHLYCIKAFQLACVLKKTLTLTLTSATKSKIDQENVWVPLYLGFFWGFSPMLIVFFSCYFLDKPDWKQGHWRHRQVLRKTC